MHRHVIVRPGMPAQWLLITTGSVDATKRCMRSLGLDESDEVVVNFAVAFAEETERLAKQQQQQQPGAATEFARSTTRCRRGGGDDDEVNEQAVPVITPASRRRGRSNPKGYRSRPLGSEETLPLPNTIRPSKGKG